MPVAFNICDVADDPGRNRRVMRLLHQIFLMLIHFILHCVCGWPPKDLRQPASWRCNGMPASSWTNAPNGRCKLSRCQDQSPDRPFCEPRSKARICPETISLSVDQMGKSRTHRRTIFSGFGQKCQKWPRSATDNRKYKSMPYGQFSAFST